MLKQGEHASGHQSKLVDLELKCVGVLFICTYLHLVRVLFCLTTQKAVERCLILDPFPTDDGARMSYPLRLHQIDHNHTYKPHIQCSYAYLLLA